LALPFGGWRELKRKKAAPLGLPRGAGGGKESTSHKKKIKKKKKKKKTTKDVRRGKSEEAHIGTPEEGETLREHTDWCLKRKRRS